MNTEIERLTQEVMAAKDRLREAQRHVQPQRVEDWALRNPDGSSVRLSELFEGREDLLVVHNMGRPCVYCTLWADGFRGYAPHLENRCAFVLCSADEPSVLREFAAGRGWNFRCVSGAGSGFAKAMGMTDGKGGAMPGVSAFHRQSDGSIVRTGVSPFGPGDDFCAVWPMLDLLKGGPSEWEPKYVYKSDGCCGGSCACG